MSTKKQRIDALRDKLVTNDRWLIVGLLTIYQHQTMHERTARVTEVSNGVGFNGPDGSTLTSVCQHILRRTTMEAIRRSPNIRLEDVLDKTWAIEAVRKRMPKYAGQLYQLSLQKAGQ